MRPASELQRWNAPAGAHPAWMYLIPSFFTALRLLAVPLLWVLALQRWLAALGVGLALAALTDVIDGFLARRLHLATAFGSRLDSIADHLLSASTVAWLVLLRPEFIRQHQTALLLWLALALAVLLVGLLKFRRPADLHLYSAKLASSAAYLMAVYLLLVGQLRALVFYLVLALCIYAALETLLVQLTRSRVDEHFGTWRGALRRR